MILNALARWTLRHPRALAVLDGLARLLVRCGPYLPGLYWFAGGFYGSLTVLSAATQWWPGVVAFAVFGVLSAGCVRGAQHGAGELARTLGGLDGARGGEPPC